MKTILNLFRHAHSGTIAARGMCGANYYNEVLWMYRSSTLEVETAGPYWRGGGHY